MIEGAGGIITDWKGHDLHWDASPDSRATSRFTFFHGHIILICLHLTRDSSLHSIHHLFSGFNVVAAGDKQIHQQVLDSLQWN